MPKTEIRLPNLGECAKEPLQTKEIKTMNKGFEGSSHTGNSKGQINMKDIQLH